jgi:hypothetical protein
MPRLLRPRSIAAAVLGALALAAAPAHAFDAGPHTDMTSDALTAEGFGSNAANVGVVENLFVDYYWNRVEPPIAQDRWPAPAESPGGDRRTRTVSSGLVVSTFQVSACWPPSSLVTD